MTTDAAARLRTEIEAQLDRIGRLYLGCFEREMDATKALVLGDAAEANRLLTEVEQGRAMAWQATIELAAKVAEMATPTPGSSGPNACVHCGRPSNHTHGDTRVCCRCHVEGGSPPADWHPECMRVYREIKARPAEPATPTPESAP